MLKVCVKLERISSFIFKKRARARARTHTHTQEHAHAHECYCSTDTDLYFHITYLRQTVQRYVIPAYVTRQNCQIYPVKGCTNGVEWWIRQCGVTSMKTDVILHSNIPTVTHNSRHYSVQTAGKCNTPRFISSLLIELPIQSMATNTDFDPGFLCHASQQIFPW